MAINGKSTYLSNAILDTVFGGSAYSQPATVYIALFLTLPNPDGTGGTEVSGTGYVRKSMTNNNTNFPAASAAVKSNGTIITFATAGGSWGTVNGFCIFDNSVGGNLLYGGPLSTVKVIGTGDVFSFQVGEMVLAEA